MPQYKKIGHHFLCVILFINLPPYRPCCDSQAENESVGYNTKLKCSTNNITCTVAITVCKICN